MKNLLKLAVAALALSCFQAYGHLDCESKDHHFVCNREDAICEAKRRYEALRIFEVRYVSLRRHYRITMIDRRGNLRPIIIELNCGC